MNLQKSITRIIGLFKIFLFTTEAQNRANLYDINSLAEDVLIPVFKDIYKCQFLRNLNTETRNYPGLDLGDDQARIAFQVTSDPSLEKIKETLGKVVMQKHYLRYDEIYVYILKQKQNRYNRGTLRGITKGFFDFEPAKHIIDSRDIVEKLRSLDYDTVRRVEETLNIHVFGDPQNPHQPGPNMASVQGWILDRDGVSQDQICDTKPNGVDVHLEFKPGVSAGDNFKLVITFDREFKDGEGLTYTPTDDEGAAIA